MSGVDWQGLISHGFNAFPLPPRAKKAAMAWEKFQTERPAHDLVQRWLAKPELNGAIVTGKISGIFVVDIDSDDARKAFFANEVPPTAIVKTAKGWHLYFKYPGFEVRNSAGKIMPGVDIRGDGGYVVCPGSIHPDGTEYIWEDSSPIAEAPDWLLDLLRPKERAPIVQTTVSKPLGASVDAYVRAAIDGELKNLRKAANGTRNVALNNAALKLGSLIGQGGLTEQQVRDLLFAEACDCGYVADDGETAARKTIESGLRKGMEHQRAIPEREPRSPNVKKTEAPHEEPANSPLPMADITRATEITLPTAQPYRIKSVIHDGDLSVMYGQSGCGKTFKALDFAHAIATGRSVLDRRVRAAPVLLCPLEGSAGFPKRVTAIQAVYGPAPELFVYRKPLTLFQNEQGVASVIEAAKTCGARVIVIDTLSRAASGANENSPEDMTHMVGVFDRIRAATGAHVMIVHHSGKNESLGARGHSSLRAAVDIEMEVTAGEGGRRALRITKGRDDADGQEYPFALKVVELGQDEDGEAITTCVVEEASEKARTARHTRLTDKEMLWLKTVVSLFGTCDLTQVVKPHAEMPSVKAVRREDVRHAFQKAGWLDAEPGQPLASKDRGKVRDILKALEAKGRICSTAEWVWLL